MDYTELIKELRESPANKRLMIYAADAIEELSRENESLAKSVNEASEILRKRWIPVTERVPEKEDMVIFYYAWTGRSGTEYKEVTLASLRELQYCGSKPIAWMPLPEPPKEEIIS